MRRFIALFMACLSLLSCPSRAAGPMEVRYWDWTRTPARDDYQFAVLQLALERSKARYGDYRLERVEADYSTLRSRQEVSNGATVNVQASPWRPLIKGDPSDQRIPVNVPIMSGLLGYRFLLIRKEDRAKFDAIRHPRELKTMVAGQGREWAELGLYRRHGFRIMDSGNINTLVPMLANRRFDYLPMSVTEVGSVLALHPELQDQLMVAPKLMISYPLPSIFYVSARYPALARRIEHGLQLARRDGALDAMVRLHFDKEIASLGGVTRHFVMLDPSVPKSLRSQLPNVLKLTASAP